MRTKLRKRAVSLCALLLLGAALAWGQPAGDGEPGNDEDLNLFERFLRWREARIERTDTYLLNLTGAGYAALQDLRMSPRIYRAPGFVTVSEQRDYRPRESFLQSLFFQFAYPITEETLALEETYLNMRGTLDFTYLHRVRGLPLQVGGGLSGTGNLRTLDSLQNSALNYDIVVSAEAAGRWQQEFSLLGRPAEWYVEALTPLFSWVVRQPAYNVSYAGGSETWAFPWDFYRVRLSAGFSRLLDRSDENRFSVEYTYDFYGMSQPDATQRLSLGNHSIVLGYAMKTK